MALPPEPAAPATPDAPKPRHPKAPKNIPEKRIAALLRTHDGIQTKVATALGVSRSTISERIGRSPKLQKLLRSLEEEMLDLGEGHILKGLRDGDKDYVKLHMTQKGRRRGYGNTVQTSFEPAQLEAIIESFGGDIKKLRAFRASLDRP